MPFPSNKSNELSVQARINSSRYVRLCWEPDADDKNGHAAIFKVKCGKTPERAVKESCERSAAQPSADLQSVASAVEGSDLGPTEDSWDPTASCIYDTKKEATGNQIWSSETKVLCVPSPPQAGNEFACCCSRILRNSASTSESLQG